jgi:hypothetical protein
LLLLIAVKKVVGMLNSAVKMPRYLSLLALSVCASLGTSSARADSAPIGADWSYGEYSSLSSPTFSSFAAPVLVPISGTTLEVWQATAANPNHTSNYSDPNVIYNTGTSDFYTDPSDGNILIAAKSLDIAPLDGPTVVRYTAPAAGFYGIDAQFQTAQLDNASPTAYVYVGGVQNWSSGQLAAPTGVSGGTTGRLGDASIYDGGLQLTQGEAVDFVVWGDNTDNKTTQLSVAISAPSVIVAPLPASAGMGFTLLGGFTLVAGVRKHLSRRRPIATM